MMGYVMFVSPILQLPLLGTVLCMTIQIGGTWYFWSCIICFLAAQIVPSMGVGNAFGPHSTVHEFIEAKKFRPKVGYKKKTTRLEIPVEALQASAYLASFLLLWRGLELSIDQLDASIGVKQILGQLDMLVVQVIKGVLNFFKGKTFTVVMSADCFIMILLALEKYITLCPDLTEQHSKKMAAGLLITVHPEQAAELLQKFDQNGDGHLDMEEVQGMIKEVNHDFLEKREIALTKANQYVRKKREKRKKKEAQTHKPNTN